MKGGLRGDRHPPYQGGQGGSNLKSIFNLIITSYLGVFSSQSNVAFPRFSLCLYILLTKF
ncbi:MAG: hypothetical protein EWV64_09190 [Microcystis flos-aquae Ma_QC_C_20070823_S18]|uniref:Uncharacterized protein n=1 Tax=Microcystis flos-aquae Mf_QC_C_20070823_S10D TaxID=2486236 RepID=A0A552L0W0_9CHRO|nr:MAG: hypothetical protein EWV64_09190 [Microcystis flos-aquae Ma_QC_C_20070823_S18]TRT95375.1 MAG: hypothetical protein EWV65_15465 [Microcystis flos-aquae Ma_QC_C_20070823_S18D]TRV13870.1 MAG: hypothetical protein EWV45_06790 [Microcystis flos-aquae Mf_QC_C_20070823_S10D]TRV19019.1 MAG: hypothetical protein EWV72_22505 [Microcystis flos-aquae Mf_QC_C_20070823_S10]TRV30673.1 MAG: hypothetical protein EWV70_18715 [Microcystis flos-aquae Mf_QC_C_20070823_S20]TRV33286.1 MAG: hypothetical prote